MLGNWSIGIAGCIISRSARERNMGGLGAQNSKEGEKALGRVQGGLNRSRGWCDWRGWDGLLFSWNSTLLRLSLMLITRWITRTAAFRLDWIHYISLGRMTYESGNDLFLYLWSLSFSSLLFHIAIWPYSNSHVDTPHCRAECLAECGQEAKMPGPPLACPPWSASYRFSWVHVWNHVTGSLVYASILDGEAFVNRNYWERSSWRTNCVQGMAKSSLVSS